MASAVPDLESSIAAAAASRQGVIALNPVQQGLLVRLGQRHVGTGVQVSRAA